MSRALVGLDQLRQLTDGSDADLAALLSEVVAACPIAGPWREVRIRYAPSWSRELIVRGARSDQFPALVEARGEAWNATARGRLLSAHSTPEEARAAADARLKALGWLLLGE